MNLNKVFIENKDNILFSDISQINKQRQKFLSNFKTENLDIKNNESISNVDIKNLFFLNYNYKKNKILSDIELSSSGQYILNLLNGNCKAYKDDKIDISNVDNSDSEIFFKNSISLNKDFIIDLNSLFLNSGVKIIIKKNQTVDLNISNIVSEHNLTIFQKNLIICEEGSKVSITENFKNKNSSMSNIFNLFDINKNAIVNYNIIQNNSATHDLFLSSFANCKKNSFYNQKVFNFSEGFVRNFHYSDLIEQNSESSHKGYFFLKNSNSTNNKTNVRHLAESCTSNQIYKGVLNDDSKSSYYSNTVVEHLAQKTEGYQLSKGILLSKDAYFFSKPELKIYADDVKCSHGSTIGPIDENIIFYLRSRGISKLDSIKMLVSSFLYEDMEKDIQKEIFLIINDNLNKFLESIK